MLLLTGQPEARFCNTLAVKGYLQSTLVDYELGEGAPIPPSPHLIAAGNHSYN
ncbi:hypothetical protein [Paenibacillus algorifonticola]|uniref:hypothetical protein n=1 Tax=Paenibacillus algorifonticola TaxID=684063 RepID=UPI000A49011D|nr:hypothetical protein [Paenibacillus algorifonticola]